MTPFAPPLRAEGNACPSGRLKIQGTLLFLHKILGGADLEFRERGKVLEAIPHLKIHNAGFCLVVPVPLIFQISR